ncbi:MAG: hypothetical protein KIS76_03805 [Pyrinomonadaceae bacterium]|nr:hypothetical protein [Pyrinomonadaceae bacterium]
MTVVDHLKGKETDELFLEVAFGRHVIEGDLAKSVVTGASPTHVVKIQQMLGEAFGKGWFGPVGVWFRGINRAAAKYKFYPGIKSPGDGDATQGIDSVFDKDTPHSNTAWIRVECPNGSETGIPAFDTKNDPPEGLSGIYNCQLGDIYDDSGTIVTTDELLTNPADVAVFGCKEIRRYPNSRLNFPALEALRVACDQIETPDYTTLPQGLGLTGRYYDGTAFNTLKSKRFDPIIQYEPSTGAPALNLTPTGFSVRWEGKIRFRYSETYTLYLTHNDGGRLWINNLSTPLIDQWGTTGEHTATFAATADQWYDIKLEWNNAAGDSQFKFEWQSASQPRAVVPQDRLYPKNESAKRFECHAAFTGRTNFDEFLRQVMLSCNGGFQDADGKLKFFCIDDLTASFTFDETNIVKNTFKFSPRYSQQDLLNLPNRYIAEGRDLMNRYLGKFDPKVIYDVPELRAIAGRSISETVYVGNATHWQALKNLEHYAKLKTARNICEFEGMPETLGVLPGDLVTVTHELSGWTNKPFLCLEAADKSIDSAADERIFKLLEWGKETESEEK